jgi:hypothetical protein
MSDVPRVSPDSDEHTPDAPPPTTGPITAVVGHAIGSAVGTGNTVNIGVINVQSGCPQGAPTPTVDVEDVLDYLDALAERAACLPAYFPPRLRNAGGSHFDAIRQMVQVVEDRSAWNLWRAEERERARAAGFDDDRRAYAPGRARSEDRLDEDRRDDRPAPPPPVPWDEQAAARFPRAVILGDPGFGKSWLLRYEARRLARAAASLLRERADGLDTLILPLWARLSDVNCTDGPVEDAVAAGQSEAFHCFVRQRLKTGNAVVLLDAWDEVPVEVPPPGQPIAYQPGHPPAPGPAARGVRPAVPALPRAVDLPDRRLQRLPDPWRPGTGAVRLRRAPDRSLRPHLVRPARRRRGC